MNTARVIHPESDWLWLTSELGSLSAVCCAIAVFGLFLRPAHPGTKGEKEILLAVLIAMGAFLVNSLFDVPGHRLGTPLADFGGLRNLHPCESGRRRVAGHSVGEPSLGNRVGGLRLCPDEGDTIPHPARGRYEWPGLEQNRNGGFELSEAHPLDWTLYVTRGYANVSLQKWLQAVADFRYALLLERKLPMVPFDEGRAWVGVNRELALAAWNECLRRSSGTERNEFYRLILGTSYCDPRLREEALRLSDTDAQLAMTALRSGYADSTSWNFSRRGNRLWVRTNSKPCCGRKPRKRRSIKNSRKRAKLGGKG